ncbi:hypothetical protein DL240_03575 [Lujinxingia litoralis]|uniref:SLH domain-containing protein n=2 Tax=Lujinxingia litoralis TaxID=2211119 RepID=A0A328CEF9_9DELT|nr:hypothetical protein DL240_03575 [Lujinxingia litoralis]
MMMAALAAATTLAMVPAQGFAHGDFRYHPPGDLEPGSGRGRVDNTVYVPGMRFPIKDAPAYANSQVHRPGGYILGGSQCDSSNYAYPWRDNYCETRQYNMPLCPSGKGHQGQDIRASTCEKDKHDVVATVDGTITGIGTYSVSLTSADGTTHRFLHMSRVAVRVNQRVTKGTVLGKVSNYMGGTPTTIHLHYDIRRNGRYIPPYLSLVESYKRLVGANEPAPEPAQPGGCVPTASDNARGSIFADMPVGQNGYGEAKLLYEEGITTGCSQSPLMFCPNCSTTRAAMAALLVRAAGLNTTTPPATPTFSDVPRSHRHYAEIEAAARAGITQGCGSGRFCPGDAINRAQAAAMVRRAAGWPQVNPSSPSFADVPTSHAHYKDIEVLADRCVTNGCRAGEFCPTLEVPRAHAATFVARAFNLKNINPCAEDSGSTVGGNPGPGGDDDDTPPSNSGGGSTTVEQTAGCSLVTSGSPSGPLALVATLLGMVALRRRRR